VVEQQDSEIIGNLLQMVKVQAKDIMTPRTVVRLASEEQTINDFYTNTGELPFSRIPLYEGEVHEHISGYCLKAELLESLVQGKGDALLSTIKRDITVVHESLPISDLFNLFLEKREHIILVVDEYGGVAGIVTMEDVIETLLGLEITDESDSTVDMQALARKNWEARARRIGLIENNPT
jgi:CBS domain containing-hemolysin-like protein